MSHFSQLPDVEVPPPALNMLLPLLPSLDSVRQTAIHSVEFPVLFTLSTLIFQIVFRREGKLSEILPLLFVYIASHDVRSLLNFWNLANQNRVGSLEGGP